MLKNTFQPKTSALKNLQEMFNDFPVVTNESLKLKMDTLGKIDIQDDEKAEDSKPTNELNPK